MEKLKNLNIIIFFFWWNQSTMNKLYYVIYPKNQVKIIKYKILKIKKKNLKHFVCCKYYLLIFWLHKLRKNKVFWFNCKIIFQNYFPVATFIFYSFLRVFCESKKQQQQQQASASIIKRWRYLFDDGSPFTLISDNLDSFFPSYHYIKSYYLSIIVTFNRKC